MIRKGRSRNAQASKQAVVEQKRWLLKAIEAWRGQTTLTLILHVSSLNPKATIQPLWWLKAWREYLAVSLPDEDQRDKAKLKAFLTSAATVTSASTGAHG